MARLFSVLAIGLVACSTSPMGRKQLILMPESQMSSLGHQAFNEMKAKEPNLQDPQVVAYVNCVARALLAHVGKQETWEVVTFANNDQVNAFALPGGKIGVYRGLLKVAKTPGQLAAVIGHEVGHVIAQHGNERVSSGLLAQTGAAVVDAALGKSKNRNLIMAGLGLGFQVGVQLPHSRTQESEADVMGLETMAKAGFDPHEAVSLWQNMDAHSRGAPPEFLSTHPSHDTRIRDLQARIPQVMAVFRTARPAPACKN